MKNFLVIVDKTDENRIAKLQYFDTQEEADAHVAFVIPTYPNAFIVENPPDFVFEHTTVDFAAKTITYNSVGFDAQKVKDEAQREINRLESTVTARRMRDALTLDEGKVWVANVEDEIKVERDKL